MHAKMLQDFAAPPPQGMQTMSVGKTAALRAKGSDDKDDSLKSLVQQQALDHQQALAAPVKTEVEVKAEVEVKGERCDIEEEDAEPSAKRTRLEDTKGGEVRFKAMDYQPDHRASRRDANMLVIFNKIKEFAESDPEDLPHNILGPGLNGFERAMAHQYCDELGLTHRGKGADSIKMGRSDAMTYDDEVQKNMEVSAVFNS